MTYSITVEIDSSEFNNDSNFYILEMKDVFSKYNFSILTHTQRERLVFLANELSKLNRDGVAFNACYNISEILFLNHELEKYGLSLDIVFIPSPQRIEKRMLEAKENARLHGRWLGADEMEVEKSFFAFKATLKEIKNGLKQTSITVVEC